MKSEFAKIELAALGLAIILFLSCTDNQPLEFPSLEEVRQNLSSSEPGNLSDAASSSSTASSSSLNNQCADEDKCGGLCYDKETQFCYNKTDIYERCNGSSYNVQTEICCGNAPYQASSYGCCNETGYLLLDYGCRDNTVFTRCGVNGLYDPEIEFCSSNNEVFALCNGRPFDPPEQSCVNNAIIGQCGGAALDYATHFCYGGRSYLLCGGNDYNPSAQFCNGTVHDKCDGEEYNPAIEFCYGTTLYPLCGGNDYNPSAQFCNGTVHDKCDGEEYDPAIYYCYNNETYSCGNKPYNPLTHSCHNDETYSCGNKPYNPATEECCGTEIYTLGGVQFCYNNSKVGNFCGNRTSTIYDPSKYECRPKANPNGIYLIGGIADGRDGKHYDAVLGDTLVWMVENLNYKTPDGSSRCHQGNCPCYPMSDACLSANADKCLSYAESTDADNENCGKYGRLYNLATAKTVCPTGWHLPSNDEWFPVSPSTIPQYAYKIPDIDLLMGGGYYYSNNTFGSINDFGYWWSSTEYANYAGAYYRCISSYHANVWSPSDCLSQELSMMSVRCVKDN